jgi:ubiquinone/menaquinone biosynthesis C-methylase UbiE
MNNWWNNFFDETFADLLLERPDSSKLRQEADFLISELKLKDGQTVFDQCCGSGEVSCALAENGINVIGVDQCAPYIARAKEKATKKKLPCDFYHGDALEFLPQKECDAAFNWYTSFGYSEVDAVNQKMLKCAYASLKQGGKFVLDYTNPSFVFQNFSEHKIIKHSLGNDELIVLKESKADIERGMLISSWTYISPNGDKKTKTGESRIYFARDLKDMLTACGFKVTGFMGGISGEPLTKNSSRCIVTAQKT